MPPDRDFVLDRVPGAPDALVALGAAHGFKFTSLFGKILSELAVDGSTASDISGFEMDRPVLTMADPPKSFLL
jgi:sarcosine oxidase